MSHKTYLCDILNLLNELNLSLQGKMTTVFKLADKVAAFKAGDGAWTEVYLTCFNISWDFGRD